MFLHFLWRQYVHPFKSKELCLATHNICVMFTAVWQTRAHTSTRRKIILFPRLWGQGKLLNINEGNLFAQTKKKALIVILSSANIINGGQRRIVCENVFSLTQNAVGNDKSKNCRVQEFMPVFAQDVHLWVKASNLQELMDHIKLNTDRWFASKHTYFKTTIFALSKKRGNRPHIMLHNMKPSEYRWYIFFFRTTFGSIAATIERSGKRYEGNVGSPKKNFVWNKANSSSKHGDSVSILK